MVYHMYEAHQPDAVLAGTGTRNSAFVAAIVQLDLYVLSWFQEDIVTTLTLPLRLLLVPSVRVARNSDIAPPQAKQNSCGSSPPPFGELSL